MDRKPFAHSDPETMSGVPVFIGTRVPVKNLIDYLKGGHPLEEFLEDFPGVTREQALSAIECGGEAMLASAHSVR
jgi:uncharacterized protein (DUF433 family)